MRIRCCAALGLAVLVLASLSPEVRASEKDRSSEDPAARELVVGYLASQDALNTPAEGNQSLYTSQQRVGFTLPGQWAWRERVLYRKEIAAFLDFNPRDPHPPTMVGKTRGSPMIGDRLLDNEATWGWFGFDPESDSPAVFGLIAFSLHELARDVPRTGPKISALGEDWIDPLSEAGLESYTYRMGAVFEDFGADSMALQTVEVSSGDSEQPGIVGAIWFDVDSGRPVRAMYRPRGRWELRSGFRGFIRAIPLVPKHAKGQVDHVLIDYEFDSAGIARPSTASLDGTMFWFFDLAHLPVSIVQSFDWTRSMASSDSKSALEASGGGIQPEPDGRWLPPPDTAFGATWLAPPRLEGGHNDRSEREELAPFVRELDRLAGPPPTKTLGATAAGLVSGVRFNHVQGVNFTARYPWYLGPRSTIHSKLTIPTSGFDLTGQVEYRKDFRPQFWSFKGYSKLADTNWFEIPNAFLGSLTAILTGNDDGNYYLAQGFSVGHGLEDLPLSGVLEAFAEYESGVERTATYSLFGGPDQANVPPILADEGMYYGVRGNANFQFGDDPQRGVAVVRLGGEAATGERSYTTLMTKNDVVGPLPGRLTGALRLTLGIAMGDPPDQTLWYLGGTKTVRGYPTNSAAGQGTYIVRAEVGTDLPLLRLVAFADIGWAGRTGDLLDETPLMGVGPGLSLLDGVVRIDVATGLNRNGGTQLSFATSGVF